MLLPGLGVQQVVQAHRIATPAAQQASAKCSSAADTPAAALLRKMAIRRNYEGIPEMNTRPNIVLIHGAWADGSCWSGVIERLQAERQPGRSFTASTGLSPGGGLQASHTAQGLRSASGSADGTTSRWVMEKARENARRAADMAQVAAGQHG